MTQLEFQSSRIATMGLLVEGGLAPMAIAIGWLVGQPPMGEIHATTPLLFGRAVIWGLLAALPMVAGLLLLERIRLDFLTTFIDSVHHWVHDHFARVSLIKLAAVCVLAGIGEELLFRGLLQAGLEDFLGSPQHTWTALAVASLIFGFAHCLSGTYVVLAALAGGYLGWLWIASGELLVPIVAHAAYDFVALIYLTRWRRLRPIKSESD